VVNGKMVLNEFGTIVDKKINELKKYKNVDVDIYYVMPNHVHLILIVGAGPCACPNGLGSTRGSGSTQGSTPTLGESMTLGEPMVGPMVKPTLGEYIKRLKTITTRIYIENVKNNNWPSFNKRLFQRNYYEHIIRSQTDLNKIREYIKNHEQSPWFFVSHCAPPSAVNDYIALSTVKNRGFRYLEIKINPKIWDRDRNNPRYKNG